MKDVINKLTGRDSEWVSRHSGRVDSWQWQSVNSSTLNFNS